MMSKRCKYALKALTRLSKCKGSVMKSAEIARLENIPKKFLENILLELKSHCFVASKMGNEGGYFILKAASDISILDVHRIFDGSIALLSCAAEKFYQPCDDCPNPETCRMKAVFANIRNQSYEIMSHTTIQDLI